jgi:UDP-GlcNAc:undecaprenyl-phosphate GlcNAc-1-phosphate transferase
VTWFQGVIAGVAAGVLTLILTWPLARLLMAYGLVDRPNHRSMHSGEVARGGGAGLTVAITVVALVCVVAGLDSRIVVVLALSLGLAAVGFLDDRLNLAFTPRLIAQLIVAVAAFALVREPALNGNATWPIVPAAVITAFWVLGCCNAVNFMDGVNGITGFHVVVFSVQLIVIGNDDELVWLPAGLSLGAAIGFLYWNAVRRKVFLGDGGAYFLGAYLALLVILVSIRTSTPLVAVAPFAVYGADTATALFRRILRHEDLTRGHREHVYQRLTLAGNGQLFVAGFTAACSAACGAAAIAVDWNWISPASGVAVILAVVGTYLTSPRWFPSDSASYDDAVSKLRKPPDSQVVR